jgi:hypothetical protein
VAAVRLPTSVEPPSSRIGCGAVGVGPVSGHATG